MAYHGISYMVIRTHSDGTEDRNVFRVAEHASAQAQGWLARGRLKHEELPVTIEMYLDGKRVNIDRIK